ncbi:MAG: 16S rRNA (adenine(1518)-N(6)/adenine(1519)-N(6))-dimethyltransferase RsmA [Alphaproteobacteria bacterium]|nr:16S rRNA (adenine(1518)-N(6)/adenine(1519)-N(6))-dimethyltransferase RsmA [Alphaproteobacteria bacterium]
MDEIANLPPVSTMMRECGMQAKKQFGQNFLFDLNLTGRIARAVPNIDKIPVVEVGPGPAGLTRALLMAGALRVVAVEMDKTTEPILSRVAAAADGRLTVVYGDALKTDFSKFGFEKYAICSNLPYNVGTELLIQWIHKIVDGEKIESMTLMFQREVAERIIAHANDDAYGRLAVLVGLTSNAKILFNVPRTAFTPAPRVTSAVVQIIPNADKIKSLGKNLANLEKLTAKLFGMRRKMIRGIMPDVDWSAFDLTGTERAENLSPEKFLEISKKVLI